MNTNIPEGMILVPEKEFNEFVNSCKKVEKFFESYFSDSDFDRDGYLSGVEADFSVSLFDLMYKVTTNPSVMSVKIDAVGDWFVATSEDFTSLMVSHPNLPDLLADLPTAIKTLYKFQYGTNVEVVATEQSIPDDIQDGGHF